MTVSMDYMTGKMVDVPDLPMPQGTVTPVFTLPPQKRPRQMAGSTWGGPIPVSFGNRVVDGTCVWLGQFNDEGTAVDFAVSFGYSAMPADVRATTDIRRIWADNILIYDKTTDVPQVLSGLRMSWHPDVEGQLPDAIIAAKEGDFAPSFRDHLYVVFDKFPLSALNITQLPKIRAELADRAVRDNVVTEYDGDADPLLEGEGAAVDWQAERVWFWEGAYSGGQPVLHEYDTEDLEEIRTIPITGFGYDRLHIDYGSIYDRWNHVFIGSAGDAIFNSGPVLAISAVTGAVLDSFGTQGNSTTATPTNFTMMAGGDAFRGLKDGEYYYGAVANLVFDYLAVLRYGFTNGVFEFYDNAVNELNSPRAALHYPIIGRADLVDEFGDLPTQNWHCFVGNGTQISLVTGDDTSHSITTFKDFGVFEVRSLAYCPLDGGILVITQLPTAEIQLHKMLVTVQQSDAGLIPVFDKISWTSDPGLSLDSLALFSTNAVLYARLDFGAFGMTDGTDWKIIDLSSGVVTHETSVSGGDVNGHFFDSKTSRAISVPDTGFYDRPVEIKFDRGSPIETVDLADLLVWLAMDTGVYEESDIVLTDISEPVIGGVITQQRPFSEIVNDLSKVYDFLYYEADGKINFTRVANGENLVVSYELGVDDLAPIEDGGTETIATSMPPYDSTPAGVRIEYVDTDYDYSNNTQTFKRSSFPVVTTLSNAITQYSVPIAMPGREALERAARAAFREYAGAVSHEFRLSQYFADLTPAMVVRVVLPDFAYTIKTVEVTWNADWSISIGGTNYSMSDDVTVIGETLSGIVTQNSPAPSIAVPFGFDVPLLLGTDAPSGDYAMYYLGAGPPFREAVGDVWRTATVSYAVNSGPYKQAINTTSKIYTGRVVSVLPDSPDPWTTDDVTELEILGDSLTETVMQSAASEAVFLAGINQALVGAEGRWELVYFRYVMANSSRHFTLTSLLRGRRGTEWACGLHQADDQFILVTSPLYSRALRSALLLAADIGAKISTVAAGGGAKPSDPISLTFTAAVLKPWAPSDIAAALSGSDVVLTWARRDRVTGSPIWLTDDVPLNETAEEYELEIMDGVSVVRTVTGLTVPTFTYTAAMQTTDGFAPPVASVTIRIYQISAVVGRGFTREETVDVE